MKILILNLNNNHYQDFKNESIIDLIFFIRDNGPVNNDYYYYLKKRYKL